MSYPTSAFLDDLHDVFAHHLLETGDHHVDRQGRVPGADDPVGDEREAWVQVISKLIQTLLVT